MSVSAFYLHYPHVCAHTVALFHTLPCVRKTTALHLSRESADGGRERVRSNDFDSAALNTSAPTRGRAPSRHDAARAASQRSPSE